MKKISKVSVYFACLALALVSIWVALHPVVAYAASATGRCSVGSVTCSGVSCQSQDTSPGASGYCACTKADGSLEVKYCAEGGPVPVENEN